MLNKTILIITAIFLLPAISFPQWQWQNPYPNGHDLQSVFFIDENNGWIAVENSVLHTSDGCNSWEVQSTGVEMLLNEIFFTDQLNGWAVGDSGTIIHTSDGGNTWETQSFNTNVMLHGVFFIDADNGWVVGGRYSSEGIILHTSNGGQTWVIQSNGTVGLNTVFFIDANNGWAGSAAFISSSTNIFYTTNGGDTSIVCFSHSFPPSSGSRKTVELV